MTDDVQDLLKEDAKEKIKNFIEQIDGNTKFYPDDKWNRIMQFFIKNEI